MLLLLVGTAVATDSFWDPPYERQVESCDGRFHRASNLCKNMRFELIEVCKSDLTHPWVRSLQTRWPFRPRTLFKRCELDARFKANNCLDLARSRYYDCAETEA